MNLGLEGVPVLVAGASRGIGRGIAEALLDEGARVMLTARGAEALEDARAELAGRYGAGRVAARVGDLADPPGAAAAVQAALDAFGDLRGLVLNVGSGSARPGWDVGPEDWDAVLRTNLAAPMRVAEAALPFLSSTGGASIVAIGSIAGVEALGAPLTYSAAKAALHSWVAGAARALGPQGVRVNAVVPGNVLFPGGSWAGKLDEDAGRWEAYVRKEVPLGRFATVEEIAAPVAFLLSERASFVTGAALVVDGGQTR